MSTQVRPFVLALLALISASGILPAEAKQILEANSEVVVGAVLMVWSLVALFRNKKDKQRVLVTKRLSEISSLEA